MSAHSERDKERNQTGTRLNKNLITLKLYSKDCFLPSLRLVVLPCPVIRTKQASIISKTQPRGRNLATSTMCDITAMDDLLVPLGQNNMLDPSTMGGQHFLLDATNLSRFTARECNDIPHVYGWHHHDITMTSHDMHDITMTCMTWHDMTWHDMTWMTSPWHASHDIPWHAHMTSHDMHHMTWHHMTWHHMTSHHMTSPWHHALVHTVIDDREECNNGREVPQLVRGTFKLFCSTVTMEVMGKGSWVTMTLFWQVTMSLVNVPSDC